MPEPQEMRDKIGDLILELSKKKPDSINDGSYQYVWDLLNTDIVLTNLISVFEKSPLEIFSDIVRIGTPSKCIWAGCFGIELTLCASVFNVGIVVLTDIPTNARKFNLNSCTLQEAEFLENRDSKTKKSPICLRQEGGTNSNLYVCDIVLPLQSGAELQYSGKKIYVYFSNNHFMAVRTTRCASFKNFETLISKINFGSESWLRHTR